MGLAVCGTALGESVARRCRGVKGERSRITLGALPMRLLHVIRSVDSAMGGPTSVALALAAAQVERGHQVEIVSSHGQLDPGDGITHRVVPTSALSAVLRRAASFPGTWDFAHLHGLWDPVLATVAQKLRRERTPWCVCLHGMLLDYAWSHHTGRKRVAMALWARGLLRDAAFVHCLSPREADAVRHHVPQARPEIIPNGISPLADGALPQRGAMRQRLRIPAEAPLVLFLSRLHPHKGVETLASAMALVGRRINDAWLVLAGPPQDAALVERLRQMQPALGGRLVMPGPLWGADKLQAYADADVFCLPSAGEASSVAILEAMAAGLPVVVSPQCGAAEVATLGAGLVVEPQTDALAAALTSLLADAARRERMGTAGREWVLRERTWPRIAAKLESKWSPR